MKTIKSDVDMNWEMVKLEDVTEIIAGHSRIL